MSGFQRLLRRRKPLGGELRDSRLAKSPSPSPFRSRSTGPATLHPLADATTHDQEFDQSFWVALVRQSFLNKPRSGSRLSFSWSWIYRPIQRLIQADRTLDASLDLSSPGLVIGRAGKSLFCRILP